MTAETRDALRYEGYTDALDISQVQTITDAEAVKDAGFKLITCKASEGLFYCDPRVLGFLDQFRKIGLMVNVYGFARPSQGHPVEQAKKLYECAGDTFPSRCALDFESAPDSMTAEELVAFGEAFIEEVMGWGALAPMVYLYPDFTKRRLMPALAKSAIFARCALWMAQYMSTTSPWLRPREFAVYTPAPWTAVTMHQYSANGGYRVRGIAGDIDRDLFYGDEQALRDFFGQPHPDQLEPDAPVVHAFPEIPPREIDSDE